MIEIILSLTARSSQTRVHAAKQDHALCTALLKNSFSSMCKRKLIFHKYCGLSMRQMRLLP